MNHLNLAIMLQMSSKYNEYIEKNNIKSLPNNLTTKNAKQIRDISLSKGIMDVTDIVEKYITYGDKK